MLIRSFIKPSLSSFCFSFGNIIEGDITKQFLKLLNFGIEIKQSLRRFCLLVSGRDRLLFPKR